MTKVDVQTRDRIDAVLSRVEDLKPLPGTVTEALRLLDDPNASIKAVATVISVDQALTSRVLKLANSAYYGSIHSATTLREAIARLGFRRTRNLLYTASYSSLLGQRVASYNLGHGELWRHSVGVAVIAEQLADQLAYPNPDEAYIGGLLHDIGKLVLDQQLKIEWDRLLQIAQLHDLMLIEAEVFLLGLNHAQVGGELMRRWSLPPCLVDAVAYHHDPTFAKDAPELASMVHVANTICLRLGVGLAHATFVPRPSAEALQLLALDQDGVDHLVEVFGEMLGASFMADQGAGPAAA